MKALFTKYQVTPFSMLLGPLHRCPSSFLCSGFAKWGLLRRLAQGAYWFTDQPQLTLR